MDATTEIAHSRKQGGSWLRKSRQKAGLSQRDLAARLDLKYYTFVSQVETGRASVPPELYEPWAEALGIDVKLFVKTVLKFWDPVTYSALFDSPGEDEA